MLAASVPDPATDNITDKEKRAYASTGNFFRDTLGTLTAAGDSGALAATMTAPIAFAADPTGVFNLTKDATTGITSVSVTPGDKNTLYGAARQSVAANGPFNPGLAIARLPAAPTARRGRACNGGAEPPPPP